MAVKKTGISRELIIHPGETIADVLEDRSISQIELAASTGVSPAYVSNVISGKKDISAKFAYALEYALGVPKSFWLNLQANYDAELLEANEENTITDEERTARESLKDIVRYLRQKGKMPVGEKKEQSILSLRKALKVSNIVNVREMVPAGAFRMSKAASVDPYVLGAWIRLCQIASENRNVEVAFSTNKVDNLVGEIKSVMMDRESDIQGRLTGIFSRYGIDFSVVKNFRGAPVQGYVAPRRDGSYQMVVTIRNAYADIFWFSLFHELGHIVNGDIGKNSKFIDDGSDVDKEAAADEFARNKLISETDYQVFLNENNFEIESIKRFAATQNVMPYIVIGRLQKEKQLDYTVFSNYKLRYEWAEEEST
ncbi:MAG: HigA family addiction module antitoxin [Eubacteriales bacterium]|nr:HigA family addiction module antitoxin [Eubacteriales bacterium]